MIPFLRAWLLAACLALAGACPAGAATAVVDVNKASQAELETVKGIGPAMSTKILAARKSGDFKSWDDLMQRVSGMGPGNAKRMSQAGLRVAGSVFQSHTAVAPKGKPARDSHTAREGRATRETHTARATKPASGDGERSRAKAGRAPEGTAAAAPGSAG